MAGTAVGEHIALCHAKVCLARLRGGFASLGAARIAQDLSFYKNIE